MGARHRHSESDNRCYVNSRGYRRRPPCHAGIPEAPKVLHSMSRRRAAALTPEEISAAPERQFCPPSDLTDALSAIYAKLPAVDVLPHPDDVSAWPSEPLVDWEPELLERYFDALLLLEEGDGPGN